MDEIIDTEELENFVEFGDELSVNDIKHLTSDEIFLALIEPKSFAYPELSKVFRETLSDEALREAVFSGFDISEDELKELRKDTYLKLEQLSESREIVFAATAAALAPVNGRLYDFIHFCYFEENNYYINQAMPFAVILDSNDWWFVDYEENGLVALALSEGGIHTVQEFLELNFTEIDKNASEKVLKLVRRDDSNAK